MAFDVSVSVAINAAADALNWPPRAFAAVVEVESKGKAFTSIDGRPLPLILFEPHVFYRCLPKSLRKRAVDANLARPKWGQLPYPKSQKARYNQLSRARAIHLVAGYKACSWGVGQVLGENAEWLEFSSAQSLAETAMDSIEGQLDLMIRFIRKRGLVDELKARDWRGFARQYNGSGQVDHYSKLMANAYKRHGGVMPEDNPLDDDVVLRIGSKGSAVTDLQMNLRRLGFHLFVDGDFGPATKTAVSEFQRVQQLEADGVAGPATLGRVEALLGRDIVGHL